MQSAQSLKYQKIGTFYNEKSFEKSNKFKLAFIIFRDTISTSCRFDSKRIHAQQQRSLVWYEKKLNAH